MWYVRWQVRHVQTWWWNEEVEKSKFKVWCWAKGTTAEKAVLKEYIAPKKIAKKAVAQAQQWEKKRLGEKPNTEDG